MLNVNHIRQLKESEITKKFAKANGVKSVDQKYIREKLGGQVKKLL